MFKKKSSPLAHVLACCFLPMSAMAIDTVTLNYDTFTPNTLVNVSLDGNAFKNVFAGLGSFTKTDQSGGPIFPSNFDLFCVELQQVIGVPSTGNVFNIDTNLSTSFPSTGSGSGLLDLQVNRVTNLQALYFTKFGVSNYNPSVLLSATDKLAFQVAIWELGNDDFLGTSTSSVALASDAFRLDAPANVLAAAILLLDGVKAELNKSGGPGQMLLYGLSSATVQDFLIPASPGAIIPEPSVYALITGFSAMGVAFLRRRASRSA